MRLPSGSRRWTQRLRGRENSSGAAGWSCRFLLFRFLPPASSRLRLRDAESRSVSHTWLPIGASVPSKRRATHGWRHSSRCSEPAPRSDSPSDPNDKDAEAANYEGFCADIGQSGIGLPSIGKQVMQTRALRGSRRLCVLKFIRDLRRVDRRAAARRSGGFAPGILVVKAADARQSDYLGVLRGS